jgi:hypothetical protein
MKQRTSTPLAVPIGEHIPLGELRRLKQQLARVRRERKVERADLRAERDSLAARAKRSAELAAARVELDRKLDEQARSRGFKSHDEEREADARSAAHFALERPAGVKICVACDDGLLTVGDEDFAYCECPKGYKLRADDRAVSAQSRRERVQRAYEAERETARNHARRDRELHIERAHNGVEVLHGVLAKRCAECERHAQKLSALRTSIDQANAIRRAYGKPEIPLPRPPRLHERDGGEQSRRQAIGLGLVGALLKAGARPKAPNLPCSRHGERSCTICKLGLSAL